MTVTAEAPTTARKFAPGASFFREALNPLLATDVYKIGHRNMYGLASDTYEQGVNDGTKGITKIYSNMTARGSRVDGVRETVHWGLQFFLQDYCIDSFRPFFAADVDDVCEEYERRITQVIGPNNVGSEHIRALHALGYLPLRFCSVPEGTLVPVGVPSFTVENTIDEFFWLTNYIETVLSASVWQASTSATTAWHLRQMLNRKAQHTGTPIEFVDWQGHDFSYRGMAGTDAATASSAGHLLSFKGSDTLPVLDWVDYFYPGSPEDEVILGSVPATEHSVMCTGIAKIGEQEMISRLLDLHNKGKISIVCDSFDLFKVLDTYLVALRDKILNRAEGDTVVIRPDSGDPVKILCGDPDAEPGSTAYKGVIESLWETFGGTVNAKNFKVLNSRIGAIYGDGIYYERADEITEKLAAKGFASGNVVFGIGSYTYTHVTRDTYMSAIKCTAAVVDNDQVDVLKDPITDDGTKKSATGRLAVGQMMSGKIYLIEKATPEQEARSLLQPVWENGKFLKFQSFHNVRETLKRSTGIRQRMLARDQH